MLKKTHTHTKAPTVRNTQRGQLVCIMANSTTSRCLIQILQKAWTPELLGILCQLKAQTTADTLHDVATNADNFQR
jgi:hypothetical protein